MDANLDTLKREILEYLDSAAFAVFHGSSGGLENLPLVLWDTEHHPDYRAFLEVAQKSGIQLIILATREFETDDVDDLLGQLDDLDLTREELREFQARLRGLRIHEGQTCSIELAFDHQSRLYVYQVQPDWYHEFLGAEDEILSRLAGEDDEDEDDFGGYFSKN